MRDYGKVHSKIWESTDFRSLSEDGRALVMYLLTCQHGTIAGVFRVPDGYACEDLQWTAERVSEGFSDLHAKGFATRCDASKWVWVRKFMEWNPPENPNQRKAAAKVALSVPDGCAWKLDFMRACGPSLGIEPPPAPTKKLKGSATVSQPFPNQYQEQKQEQEQEQQQDQEQKQQQKDSAGPRASRSPAPSAAVWDAYSEAYEVRYGQKPIRNATVNAVLAQLVSRLGAEAPDVARFYVGHNKAYYVSCSHAVQALLKDAEGLRTQWATGRQTTATQAQHADKTQTNFNAFAPLLAEARAKESIHG